ncbi:MAG: glycosyl hydrolase family protein [Ruminococcaceae bacterium]|nr:glycosyl hydrolase family protein [Oscillospiraceae bacterium]
MKKRIWILTLLAALLVTGCGGKGGIEIETLTREERAESYRIESESIAAAESESLRLEQEAKKAEAEARKKAEEEAKALKESQLAEDKEMAVRDFEENRYTTFDGVEYELTFMDSFNGHYLDTDKWAYCPNWTRDDCVWTEEAAYLEDGALILAVTGDRIPYEAGAIRTRDIFEQAYGYWEVRAKLPQAEGINAAFWLMCDGAGHGDVMGGADGAEIDIIEAPHHDWQQVQHAVHMDGYEDKHKSVNYPMDIAGIYDDAWHTFSLVWTPENYFFYIDGELTWTVRGNWICQVPCYAKLTAAVGGWAGVLDPKATPVYGMQVDYIKVYLPVEGYAEQP